MKKREMTNIGRALLRSLQSLPEKDREAAVAPLLAELGRIHKLPHSLVFFRILERAWGEMFGPQEVSLVTAHRIPPVLKERFTEAFPYAEVRSIIDPRLIGGAVLRIDDRILDNSVVGALERMKKNLLGGLNG